MRIYAIFTVLSLLAIANAAVADNDKPAPSNPAPMPSALSTTPSQGLNIQFGIPAHTTLAEMRKQVHQKADLLDKMTPQDWAKQQAEFHAEMERISKLPPEEQHRLYPNVPPEILSHLSHAGMAQPGAPRLTAEQSLDKARKNAHAKADTFDKMTDKQWQDRVKRSKDAVEKYKSINETETKRKLIDNLMHERPENANEAPIEGQSKIPSAASPPANK